MVLKKKQRYTHSWSVSFGNSTGLWIKKKIDKCIYRFRADTFLGDFFLSLGRDLSCSNPSLSKSCLMAILASCSISLKVSLMLRNTEKKCWLDLVLTLITSGKSRVAFFSSWIMSTHRMTSLAAKKKVKFQHKKITQHFEKQHHIQTYTLQSHFSPLIQWLTVASANTAGFISP